MSLSVTTTTTVRSTTGDVEGDPNAWGTWEHVVVLEEHQDEPLTLSELAELVATCQRMGMPDDTQTSLYGGVEVKWSWRSR
ncbi:MAG: hypothetical protein BGO38_07935 [Cellulomonas sp. 73-145]|uniref:hypothetical protein n=1 Tax=Cellulomonas sp. 73-145 TaxID=1895739 RepID=UPI00092913B5|nr:hypothetical protein [Cellulomonas sp. 73-145]MBN9326215.1 hypothetical protein [Cellulomonas sp.]OJV58122.1 MAG: hypothetical protein BGO38_07935 [Cellulomonas sp. 73-145]